MMLRPTILLLSASAAAALLPQSTAVQRPVLSVRRACALCMAGEFEEGKLVDGWEALGRADDLAADVARFKAAEAAKVEAAGGEQEPGLLDKTIDTLGTVLTYNFFIICTFFAWFLTGCAFQFGLKETAIIDAFRGCWDFLILPLLTTHMTLTFLSYGLEKLAGRGESA